VISKKIVIVAAVLVSTLLLSTIALAQILQNVDADTYKAQAQKDFDNAKTYVERLRNASFTDNVHLYVITRQEAVDRWGRPSADANLALIQRQENVYKTLFIINENDSLYQATVDWTANWGAATVGNDIYVIRENFDPFKLPEAEATFVHELTHVWQPNLAYTTTFDETKAHDSLVEGDASYMGDYFLSQNRANATASPMVTNIPVFLIDNPMLRAFHPIPDTIWQLNFFPYDQGKTFAMSLFEQGGWQTINDAYNAPPNNTEQIIHPDKYFAGENAQLVSAPQLGENNWNLIKTDRNQNSDSFGEIFLQVMLSRWVNKTQAQNAAKGWAGDNFTYYERGSDYLFTWNIKWDSTCDASDFYVTFHNMANAAGAVDHGSCNWYANGRYLSITWDQTQNTTLVAGSNVKGATDASYFGLA
jgi:hypothetical protein